MKITSITTWLLPSIVLLIASFLLVLHLYGSYLVSLRYFMEEAVYLGICLPTVIIAVALYYGFKKITPKISLTPFKITLLLLPTVLQLLLAIFILHIPFFSFSAVGCGVFLYLAYLLLGSRYTATLTETAIEYENLLGQTGEIDLTVINKLEQKRNMLAIFREFRFLKITDKTSITFCDENLDEYEINVFPKAFKSRMVFDKIIENANKRGNLKIRQYVA